MRHRLWVLVGVPVLALAVLVVALARMEYRPEGWSEIVEIELTVAIVVVPTAWIVVVVLALAARAVLGRAGPDRVAVPAISAGVTLGAIAALPVFITWDDGCNGHAGDVPLIAAPVIEVSEPADPRIIYRVDQTLVFCG